MNPATFDIYARLSHDKKKGGDLEGVNVDDQIDRCSQWITARGDQVGEIYRDDSISATSGAIRPGFEAMLAAEPRGVVYLKQSRLERDPGDLERFLMSGREGYALDGTRATLENASAEFLSRIMSIVGRFEQRNKAEFQRAANLRIAKAGKYRGSIRPFGQDYSGAWVQPEADAVRVAATDLVAGTATFYDVAVRWNAAGLLTPQTGKQGGKEWTSGTVRNYYTRPRLIGFQDYQGTLYQLKDWTPLLDVDTYEKLRSLIDSKRTGKRGVSKGRGDAHQLTGIVKCECGRGMNIKYRGGKGSGRVYACPTVRHQTVTAVPLEAVAADHALQLLAHQDDAKAEAEEATKRVSELLADKRAAESAHEAWLDEAITAGLSPALIARREAVHAERLDEISTEVQSLRAALGVNIFHVSHEWVSGSLETRLDGWEALPMLQRRDALESLFTGIYVARAGQGQRFDRKRVTYKYTPLGERLLYRWAAADYPFEVPAT